VPADEDEGAGGDVHYVTVEQDPGQSPEDCFVCLLVLTKASPGLFINPCVSLKLLNLLPVILCAFTFRS
jgi:hypothetical protein